jgi:hypothetical protein
MIGLCMVALSSSDLKQLQAVQMAVEDEKNCNMSLLSMKLRDPTDKAPDVLGGVVTGMPHKGFERICADLTKLSASQCSDVVRLYGTVVEKMVEKAPKTVETYKELLKAKGDERLGSGGEVDKAKVAEIWNTKLKMVPSSKAINATQVPKGNKDFDALMGRHRFMWTPDAACKTKLEKAVVEAGVDTVQAFLVRMKGGQALFGLADSSTIGKLDHAFGLVPAADISGTTADTVFFMKRFVHNIMHEMDPAFDLVPLGTIVGGTHHSTLEVALPLSQSGIVDYHIGFYTTLMPKSDTKFAGVFKPIFEQYENAKGMKISVQGLDGVPEATNRHMIVSYEKEKVVSGAWVFDGKDADEFKKFVNGKKMLGDFKSAKSWPTKTDWEALLKGKLKLA